MHTYTHHHHIHTHICTHIHTNPHPHLHPQPTHFTPTSFSISPVPPGPTQHCPQTPTASSLSPCEQAFALVADLYMGTSNGNASFRDVIGGALASSAANGEIYNYAPLDALTVGLGSMNVRPYWAITYAPWPFQPATASANASGQTACLGFENAGYPQRYSCVPYGINGFDDCWKCPPKVRPGLLI